MGTYKSKWLPPIKFSPTDHEGLKTDVFVQYVNGKTKVVGLWSFEP